ncbi:MULTISPECIES: Dps family protein [unclassified Micromonospora]|uniref:Dps family protein n=1 Tax=unclassified Micromonospora TaxID=2617518 RepID=UPI00098D22DF|nr:MULTISPECIES: DNA starvation/stationary phase protection protein [unclassified Micromonospora]MDI5939761.1 DNA starvation/stationary phase protection protein [Micromonospora sp. DH15]OON27874.1 DNA starvation/stationary phase protection protein [Micromonospora sp. Rc5]
MAVVDGILDSTDRKTTGEALQQALADLINLGMLAKQAHWNLVGPHFRSLHLQLDELADLARRYADEVAERAAAVGFNPDGRAATVAAQSMLPTLDHGDVEEGTAVEVVVDALFALIRTLRQAVADTATSDPISQDLLIGATAAVEQQHWLFRAQR